MNRARRVYRTLPAKLLDEREQDHQDHNANDYVLSPRPMSPISAHVIEEEVFQRSTVLEHGNALQGGQPHSTLTLG